MRNHKIRKVAGVVGFGALMLAAAAAQAAYTLPAAVTQWGTDAKEAWNAIEALLWPIIGAVLISMFVIRKVKAGASKA